MIGNSTIERHVTSHYHGSYISGSQKSFLTKTAIFIIEQWKEKLELPFCSWVQSCTAKSYIHFFLFSLSYLQDHDLLISRDFATMVTIFNVFSSLLLVCTWRHGGHVGGQEQKLFSPLGTKLYFHVNSWKKYSFVLTPNMAALSRGCKPRIGLRFNGAETNYCGINKNILGMRKTELDIIVVGSNWWIRNPAPGSWVSIEIPHQLLVLLGSVAAVLCCAWTD